MAKKAYKFSRKIGKYVSKTKLGNRNFYYKKLKKIMPEANFNPNSTFGKYIMKKLIVDLRLQKSIEETFRNCQSSIAIEQRELAISIRNNSKVALIRENNQINELAFSFIVKNNKTLLICRKNIKYIFIFLVIFLFLPFINLIIKIISTLVLIVAYFLLDKKYISILKIQKVKAKNIINLNEINKDLIEDELYKKQKIEKNNENLKKLKIKIEENNIKIINKTKKLINDEKIKFVLSENFYNSTDWKIIKNKAFNIYDNECVKCKSMQNLSADHILPRSKFPEKALDIENIQILCIYCNSKKGNRIL